MATNLTLSDDTPYEAIIRESFEENGGLPPDSPLLVYNQRSSDPVDQLVSGMKEEAQADYERGVELRRQELIAEFQAREPAASREDIEISATRIAQGEGPEDYSEPVNPEYTPDVHGKLDNPNRAVSWWDQLADSRVVDFIQGVDKVVNPESVGRMVAGGVADMAHSVLGSLELVREAGEKAGVAAGVRTPSTEPSILEEAQAAIPEVKTEGAAENLGRGLVQFASFFIPTMGAARLMGATSKLTPTAVSALEAFANRKPDDQTLMTWVSQVAPGLENTPVIGHAVKFMQSNPNDSEALRRFKFVLEDVTIGNLMDLGLHPQTTVQSVANMFDSVRQAIGGGKVAKDVISDQSGAIWFGRPKETDFLRLAEMEPEPRPAQAPVAPEAPRTPTDVPVPAAALAPSAVPGVATPGAVAPTGAADVPVPRDPATIMWDKVIAGETTEAGQPSLHLQVGKVLNDWGAVTSPEQFKPIADELTEIRTTKTGQDYQEAVKTLLNRELDKGKPPDAPKPPPIPPTPSGQWPKGTSPPAAAPGVSAPPLGPSFAPPIPPTAQSARARQQALAAAYQDEFDRFRNLETHHIKDAAAEARAMGLTQEDIMPWEPGNIVGDTHVAAVGQLKTRETMHLLDLARQYNRNPTPELEAAINRSNGNFASIDARHMGTLRETGRALRIAQEDGIGRGAIDRQIREAMGALRSTGDLRLYTEMLEELGDPAKIAGFLTGIQKKSKWQLTRDSVLELYINNLISGAKGLVRDMIGGVAFAQGQIGERLIAGLIDKPVTLFFGPGQGVELGEARAMLHGQWIAKMDGLRAMGDAFKERPHTTLQGEATPLAYVERPKAITAENYGIDPDRMIGKLIDFAGRTIRLPSRARAMPDAFMKVAAQNAQLHALAHRRAQQAVHSARQSGTPKNQLKTIWDDAYTNTLTERTAREEAQKYGQMVTFSDEAGRFTQGLSALADKVPLLRLLIPFINTPARLIGQSWSRVPVLGLASKENWSATMRGSRAEREMVLARQATGMAIGGIFWYMALQGRVTGEGSRNKNIQAAEQGSKIPPRSVGFGADEYGNPTLWLPYLNMAEPYSTIMGFFADLARSTNHIVARAWDGDMEPMQAASEAAGPVLQTVINMTSKKSSLVQVNNIVDAMMDSSGQKWQRIIGSLASGIAMPVLAQDIMSAADPQLREAKTAWERFQRVIPYYNDALKPRRDPLTGEPTEKIRVLRQIDANDPTASGLLFLADLAMPAQPVMRGEDTESEWVYENILRDNLTGIGLIVEDNIRGMKLEPQYHDRLEVLRGAMKLGVDGAPAPRGMTLKQSLSRFQQSPAYQTSDTGPDSFREFETRRIINVYQKAAEEQLFRENPELQVQFHRYMELVSEKKAPGILSQEGQAATQQSRENLEQALAPLLVPSQ